jgi:hypothetical protein
MEARRNAYRILVGKSEGKTQILLGFRTLSIVQYSKNNVLGTGSVSILRILVGKPEGQRPPGRPRHRWADNITVDLREMGTVINLRVP